MNETNKEQPGGLKSFELEAEKLVETAIKGVEYEVRRWPALVALMLVGVGLAVLSDRLTIGPTWLWLLIIVILIIPAVIARLKGFHQLNHWLLISLGLVITGAEAISIVLLVISLPDKSVEALLLLRDAGILWVTNLVIFSLWYWMLDAGGPHKRSIEDYHQISELLFPQIGLKGDRPALENWRPKYTDYLFVAFNNSTAFSPTDTAVLSVRLKALTMLQSILSLITLATLAARAINLL
jgi:hypothetical protein